MISQVTLVNSVDLPPFDKEWRVKILFLVEKVVLMKKFWEQLSMTYVLLKYLIIGMQLDVSNNVIIPLGKNFCLYFFFSYNEICMI